MKNNLAIVIPAYKSAFLKDTLVSISNQTNKNFTVYIGDDNSPEDLYKVIAPFTRKIKIVYKHFTENIGRFKLAAQWQRCIELVENEEWIWLFSDDDVMEENCVEQFYETLKRTNSNILHFNINTIDNEGNVKSHPLEYPQFLSALNFIQNKIRGQIKSYVVEYIFRYSTFTELGGFQNFDLAWNSDDATWFKLAQLSPIETIPNAKVYWRESHINISRLTNDVSICKRKLHADILFIIWLKSQFKKISIYKRIKMQLYLAYWFYIRFKISRHMLSDEDNYQIQQEFRKSLSLIYRLSSQIISNLKQKNI